MQTHQLKAWLDDIHTWMLENKLTLNHEKKNEFIVFGSMVQRFLPCELLENCLSPMDVVSHLGVRFDSTLSFTNHVNSVIVSCFDNL